MRNKNFLRILLSVMLVLPSLSGIGTLYAYSGAKISDMKGHWAESQVLYMLENGIVTGYDDNTFKPGNTITRAEFITMTNKTFGFEGSTKVTHIDVKQADWFYGEVAKAKAAGYISGYEDGTFQPNNGMSRQESAVIIAKILDKNSTDFSAINNFRDAKSIPSWSKRAVAAMIDSGYMKGYPDAEFKAGHPITRAEAAVLLKKVQGERPQRPRIDPVMRQDGALEYKKAGTYGPEADINSIDGNIIISAKDVILQNTTIIGDLTIAESVGDGSVTLKNVTVKGTTTINGGGPDSIILKDFKGDKIVVDTPANLKVRVVAQGSTDVGTVIMKSGGGVLKESNVTGEGFKQVTLSVINGERVYLSGDFNEVFLDIPGNKMDLWDGTIGILTISSYANNARVTVFKAAKVNTLYTKANSDIDGEGAIGTANISSNNVTISQKPSNTTISSGIMATIGGSSVIGIPSGVGGGGGGGGGSPPPLPARSMAWGGGQFNESASNDGSISNSITVTLANESFSAGNIDMTTDYTVGNLPAGLTVSVVKTGDTTAIITLSGNAGSHTAINNVNNLTISFTNNAFSGGNAASVNNSSMDNLSIIFNKGLTLMVYSDADNNLEPNILNDIAEMKAGVTDDVNLITLLDRTPGYSTDEAILGENFTDTRLYKITGGNCTRIGGGAQFPEITTTSNYEANMGDALTVKKFIQFCKTNYPADRYTLIFENHGGGSRGSGTENDNNIRTICFDNTSGGDPLYTGEISDVLTAAESVDLLGFDACVMGSVEVAYQYRPGNGSFEATVMVASAPNEWGSGWQYNNILARLNSAKAVENNGTGDVTMGGQECYYNPATITMLQLGGVIVEEQRDSVNGLINSQSLSCYDLTKAAAVKNAVDDLSVSLHVYGGGKANFEAIRDQTLEYFNKSDEIEWVGMPFFDLYDLAKRTSTTFNATIQSKANTVMNAVYGMVEHSFAGPDFPGFEEGKNGISIFFPGGDRIYNGHEHWGYQWWYNSIDINTWWPGHYYGKLKWCQDNQNPAINTVGNWFEMLDAWFDPNNDPPGGENGYRW